MRAQKKVSRPLSSELAYIQKHSDKFPSLAKAADLYIRKTADHIRMKLKRAPTP